MHRTTVGIMPLAFLRTHDVPHIKGGKFSGASLQIMETEKTLATRIEIALSTYCRAPLSVPYSGHEYPNRHL